MTLIVEDGTGVEDANGLIDVAFADSYFSDRGATAWTGDDTAKGIAIIKGTDYMELLFADRWKGVLSQDATTLSFPRVGMYDRKGNSVDFEEDGIPVDIKKACAEYSLRALTADLLPDPVTDGKFLKWEKKKVGPLETEKEWVASYREILRKYPVPDRILKNWIIGVGAVYR